MVHPSFEVLGPLTDGRRVAHDALQKRGLVTLQGLHIGSRLTSWRLALVMATLSRRSSAKNPTSLVALLRTKLRTTAYSSEM